MSTHQSQSDNTSEDKTAQRFGSKTSSTLIPSIDFVENAKSTLQTLKDKRDKEKYRNIKNAARLSAQAGLIFDYILTKNNHTKNPNDPQAVHEWYFSTEELQKRSKMTKWERDLMHEARTRHLQTLKGSYSDFLPLVEDCAKCLDSTLTPHESYKYRILGPNDNYHAQKPSEHLWDWLVSRIEVTQTSLSKSCAMEYEASLERMEKQVQ